MHSAAYEGPCRVGKPEDLTPEADERRAKEKLAQLKQNLAALDDPWLDVREPIVFQWTDDFIVHQAEIEKLSPAADQADVLLLDSTGLPQYPAVRIAERYRKPVLMVGYVATVDVTAYLRSQGLQAWAASDWLDLRRWLRILRARKALARTRMLLAMRGNVVPTGVVSSIADLEGLRARLGVGHQCVAAEEVLERMKSLPPGLADQAQALTRQLIERAADCEMTFDQLLPSVRFYMAVRWALADYECNAFTIPCFEICATQEMERERVTFCLAHTLLKDDGIPSACEADTNVLMAIATLIYTSNRSPHMGNSSVASYEDNMVFIHHDVPGLKVDGLDKPAAPYGIKNFTMAGWGGTLRYNADDRRGSPVTMLRFNPQGTAMMVVRGEFVQTLNYMAVGCALGYRFRVADARAFFRTQQDFGHHFAWVFGDWADDIADLGEAAGLDVICL